jgi:hypothetical protein
MAPSCPSTPTSVGAGATVLATHDPVKAPAPVAVVGRGDQQHAPGAQDAVQLPGRHIRLGEPVEDADQQSGVERLGLERERRHVRLVGGDMGAAVAGQPDIEGAGPAAHVQAVGTAGDDRLDQVLQRRRELELLRKDQRVGDGPLSHCSPRCGA